MASWVEQYPDRLIGIASVNLYKPMEAIKELRRCVKDLGFKGLRIVQWLWNLPPTDRRYYPLYAECIELDIPVCLQVGHTGPLCPSETGRPIPYIPQRRSLHFPVQSHEPRYKSVTPLPTTFASKIRDLHPASP